MARFKDKNWGVGGEETADGKAVVWPASWDGQQLAVLMDIRDELKRLNDLFHCHNFTSLPGIVREIKKHTGRISVRKRKSK